MWELNLLFLCVKIQVEEELNTFRCLIPQGWSPTHPAASSLVYLSYCPTASLKVILEMLMSLEDSK